MISNQTDRNETRWMKWIDTLEIALSSHVYTVMSILKAPISSNQVGSRLQVRTNQHLPFNLQRKVSLGSERYSGKAPHWPDLLAHNILAAHVLRRRRRRRTTPSTGAPLQLLVQLHDQRLPQPNPSVDEPVRHLTKRRKFHP